jgi:hypothetical protein
VVERTRRFVGIGTIFDYNSGDGARGVSGFPSSLVPNIVNGQEYPNPLSFRSAASSREESAGFMTQTLAPISSKVTPQRIIRLDQCHFLFSTPRFDLGFPSDGIVYVLEYFPVNQTVYVVSSRKSSGLSGFVLQNSGGQEASHADI